MKTTQLILAGLLIGGLTACGGKTKKADKMNEKTAATTEAGEKTGKMATKTADGTASTVTCTLAKDIRTLAISTPESGCQLVYTKFGEAKTVANSQSGSGYCERVRERIQGNLKTAGFSCTPGAN